MILIRIFDRQEKEFTKKLMYAPHRCLMLNTVRGKNIEILERFNPEEMKERFSFDLYIGKRDKNDKKIYERDICIIRDKTKNEQYTVLVKRSGFNGTYFVIKNTNVKIYPQVFKNKNIEIEIIGNVYQNKEYLKKKEIKDK